MGDAGACSAGGFGLLFFVSTLGCTFNLIPIVYCSHLYLLSILMSELILLSLSDWWDLGPVKPGRLARGLLVRIYPEGRI